jgi:hypothetical protein
MMGSCRLKMPLEYISTNHPEISLVTRYTGFLHYTKEILQRLKLARGEIAIPETFYPLVFDVAGTKKSNGTVPLGLEDCDLFMIEVSTRKQFLCDSVFLQQNLVKQFLDTPREASPVSALQDFVSANVIQSEISKAEMLNDIVSIREYIDRPLVIMSHINCRVGDGELKAREILNSHLSEIAARLGIPFVDPTGLVEEFGTAQMMKDANHLTEFGVKAVGEFLYGTFMSGTHQPAPNGRL